MLEDYFNVVSSIDNFMEGYMIIDVHGIIRFHRYAPEFYAAFNNHDFTGQHVLEVFQNLTEETSTLLRAVNYGESTRNQIQYLVFPSGVRKQVNDTTFPLKENGKIIGAVSATMMAGASQATDFIDLTHMTRYVSDLWLPTDIIGDSALVRRLKQQIYRVSRTKSNVLIYGETGSGKELVAQSIHALSDRKDKPFISQNCAAIPDTLLESIFFGTTRGAYTGAENRQGIFEQANGGTIFLDELNSMHPHMQAKLLRAIEDKKVTRIGSLKEIRVDVRIIAALNEPPRLCLENKKIRPDLFYRISSIQLDVPPLRARKEDIPALTNHFIELYNHEMHENITGITPGVLEKFQAYSWPGNIREFKNVIECGFNFSTSGFITESDIPEYILRAVDQTIPSAFADLERASQPHDQDLNRSQTQYVREPAQGVPVSCPEPEQTLAQATEAFERAYIMKYVPRCRSAAELARILGLSRQALNYKLNKYNISIRG